MALWLLCCVLLFITSRGYDWLSHQSGFALPELSLPWIILGGLGLAIASNYSAWQSLTNQATLPSDIDADLPPAVSAARAQTSITSVPAARTPHRPFPTQPSASISFKIAASNHRTVPTPNPSPPTDKPES